MLFLSVTRRVAGETVADQGTGPAKLVISAALTPAPGTDEDFDRWYKDEHYRTLAECRGYVVLHFLLLGVP